MLAQLDPRKLDARLVPARRAGRRTRRAPRPTRRPRRCAHAPESQEACFLAGDDYRAFLATRLRRRRGADRRRVGPRARPPRRLLAVHARPAKRPRRRRRRAALRDRHRTRGRTRSSSARATALARTRVSARGRLYAPAARVEAKLRYRSPAVAAAVEATADGFRLILDEPAYGVARGQAAVLYAGDVVVGCGRGHVRRVRLGSGSARRASPRRSLAYSPSRCSSSRSASASAWAFSAAGRNLRRLSSLIGERSASSAGDQQGRRDGGPGQQRSSTRSDTATDSAVDAVEAVDEAVRTVSFAVKRPVQKLAGFAAGVRTGARPSRPKRNWEMQLPGEGCSGAARAGSRRGTAATRAPHE